MDVLIGFSFLMAIAAMGLGVIVAIFWRGQRIKGLVSAGVGAVAFIGLAFTVTDMDRQNSKSKTEGSSPNALVSELENPSASIGNTQPIAYRLRNDPNAIGEFCNFEEKIAGLANEKEKLFPSDEQFEAGQAWIEPQIEGLRKDMNDRLGLQGFEVDALAEVGFWIKHCNARQKGWQIVTAQDVLSVSHKDAHVSKRVIEAYYIISIAERDPNFLQDPVSCKAVDEDEHWYVGCVFVGVGKRSAADVFLIAKNTQGALMVTPLNGSAEGRISTGNTRMKVEGIGSLKLAEFAGRTTILDRVLTHF